MVFSHSVTTPVYCRLLWRLGVGSGNPLTAHFGWYLLLLRVVARNRMGKGQLSGHAG